jgi:hypothetical protein
LIHIKEVPFLKFFPRLADVGDEIAADGRRRRGCTLVHSLAVMVCSTKVVGASTGTLTPDKLPMEAVCVGLDGDGDAEATTGDGDAEAAAHGMRRIDSHSREIDRWATFFRHWLRLRDSAEEVRERFGEGEIGDETNENAPEGLAAGGASSSPARSAAGDDAAQNRPARRPNVSPSMRQPRK